MKVQRRKTCPTCRTRVEQMELGINRLGVVVWFHCRNGHAWFWPYDERTKVWVAVLKRRKAREQKEAAS